MAIFRGVGGSGDSSDNSFLDAVTAQANSASASATSAANSLAAIQQTEVTSASFDTGNGVLTLTKTGGATVTADLDGRFLTSYTETNDLSTAVTWANVPDANITQSSVTQHQAALSITESQISDLGTYLTASDITGKANLSGATFTGNVSIGTPPSGTQSLTVAGTTTLYGGVTGGLDVTGDITVTGTVDGVDIATRDGVLTSTTTTANSAMQDLVDDTSPELGGDLDLNSNDITGTGNINISQASTSTPALHITSLDTGDVASPTIRLERFSTSTADDDNIGKIEFYAYKENLPPIFPAVEYANITGVVNDGTTSTIDGQIDFNVAKDDTLTTVMSVKPTELDVTGTITAPNVDISTTGSVTTNIATGTTGSSTATKTLNLGTGYSGFFAGLTTVNVGTQDTGSQNVFNIGSGVSTAGKEDTINLKGNVTVDGTITGWSPYYKSSEVRLAGTLSYRYLNTADQDLGQYISIYHPTTPVETSRYVDVEWSTYWNYTTSINDTRLTLQLIVPSGATTHTLGTVTEVSSFNPNYSTRTSSEEWYYVSGDKTHLFTQFGRVSQVSTGGSVEHTIRASQYDPTTDRTYFCSTNSLAAMSTGDTAYWHPYAWESAGTALIQSYDITERYRSGIDRHKVSFKLAFTDSLLDFRVKIKELASGDSAQVRDSTAKLTSVGL